MDAIERTGLWSGFWWKDQVFLSHLLHLFAIYSDTPEHMPYS
jgi:hypothetical protein